ncbi:MULTISPECIES: ABC transporter substrate-binding protein [Gulbenkiania]|uniref:ABC-type transport system, periplasmic component n=2 Tax=Gulbenkiania TaxID=397456 RepID=A0A0K6H742_9NEIS|nr:MULTISPECIES: ABC transporter substrate-binding protein [Gulbenkiania]TCW29655.1 dipeptide transport system substrate-binding protein [Gulbenkiania mobilis]CUA86816.1 ABC-type transport system, periplasmic component [Gulbenkiania indica]
MQATKKLLLAAGLVAGVSMAHAASTLIYCSEASPEGFDNAQYTGGNTFDASGHAIFSRLVEFEQGSTRAVPGLAESWSASPDGKTYTFKLRKGVKFHTTDFFKPTREFNADDVVFTFMRMIDKNHPFRKAYNVEFPYASDTGLDSNITSVEKVDPYTVRFNLKEPDADLIIKIAMPFASILSAEFGDKLLKEGKASQINQLPVGTGPFIFKRYQKDAQIRYVANKDYWKKGAVKVDNLVFAITTDPSVRYQKMKAGECHIMSYPRPTDLAAMKTDPALKMMSSQGFNIGYLSYNVEKPQLKKLEVRQALDMAINRKAIIDAVYQGQGQEAANPMPPTLWSYDKSLKNAPYDVAKAKALLAKAGYPNGFDITLWAMPVQRPYNPNAKLMAEMIQSDWAKIGVRAKIVSYEWGEYLKRMKNGEHDAGLVGWTGDYASPDNFLGVLLTCEAVGGSNYSRFCNKEFDSAVLAARKTNNQAERTKLYTKAQQIFKREMPWTTIAHSVVNQPMRKEVNGFKISPFGDYTFQNVSVK